MAVMTHAPARTEADYNALTGAEQDAFDYWMRQADNAATGPTYHDAMTEAAIVAGISASAPRDIARCSCLHDTDGCGCGVIFDTRTDGVIVTATNDPGCNLSQLQCPTCGHDHPRPVED